MAVPQGPERGLEDGVDTVGTSAFSPSPSPKGKVRCKGKSQNVCVEFQCPCETARLMTCLTQGTQQTSLKGLAQNSQGNDQSFSLVWQKAQLGSSPLLSGG